MTHAHGEGTPAPVHNRPGLEAIRYRVGDHARFLRAMVEALPRAEADGRRPLRGLTVRDAGDPAIALLDAWATACDVLTFYQERTANEAFLRTARQEGHVRRLTGLVGHRPVAGRSASTHLAFTVDPGAPVDLPKGLRVQTAPDPGQKAATFETAAPLRAEAALNRLRLHATRVDPARLGGTHAWLAGAKTGLRAGDLVLVVAEVCALDGPAAGLWGLRTLRTVEPGDGRTRVTWDTPVSTEAAKADLPVRLHAVEREARPFGHDAPKWETLKARFEAIALASDETPENATGRATYGEAQWTDPHVFEPQPATTTAAAKAAPGLDLDARYPARAGTWVAVTKNPAAGVAPDAELFLVEGVTEAARKDYLLMATVTRLLTRPAGPPQPTQPWTRFPAAASRLVLFGEAFAQAEAPALPLGPATQALDLDQAYGALAKGRVLLLEGQRIPVAGDGTLLLLQAPAPVRVAWWDSTVAFLKAPWNRGAAVEPGDVAVANKSPASGAYAAYPPGTVAKAGGAAVGRGAARTAHVLFHDADGDGHYGLGDAVYLASAPLRAASTAGTADSFTVRLTPGFGKPAGSLVKAGEPEADVAIPLRLLTDAAGGAAQVAAVEGRVAGQVARRTYVTPGSVREGGLPPVASVRIADPAAEGLHEPVAPGAPPPPPAPPVFGTQVAVGDDDKPADPPDGGRHGTALLVADKVLAGPGGRTRVELEAPLGLAFEPASVVLHGNVVAASHGETQPVQVLGDGDAVATHQAFAIAKAPLSHVDDPQGEGGVSPELVVRVGGVAWERRATLHGATPQDRAYALQHTADGTLVRFGDGDAGARLPTGVHNVTAAYRQGVGAAGNARPGQVRNLKDKPKGLKEATNPQPATGGVDPEPAQVSRWRAPQGVLTLDRVVSLRDFEDAARGYLGIAKAQARLVVRGGERVVQLTVAGDGGAVVDGQSPLRAGLVRYLVEHRAPHHAAVLRAHAPAPVAVTVRATPEPSHDAKAVRAAARAALLAAFAFERRGLGEPVHESDLLAALHKVPGLAGAQVLRLARREAPTGTPVPARLPLADHEIATLHPEDLRVLLPGET